MGVHDSGYPPPLPELPKVFKVETIASYLGMASGDTQPTGELFFGCSPVSLEVAKSSSAR